jgi:curved DNA-binding protein CbpA
MIVIEIDEESGVSHFEVLGLTPRDLDGLNEKAQTVKVTNAAKVHQKKYQKKAAMNDKDAESALQRINQATNVLKLSESRKEYIEKLGQGKAGMLDVLRIEHTAPAFFWDRAARFRVIEQLLREMGRNGNLADDDAR